MKLRAFPHFSLVLTLRRLDQTRFVANEPPYQSGAAPKLHRPPIGMRRHHGDGLVIIKAVQINAMSDVAVPVEIIEMVEQRLHAHAQCEVGPWSACL